MNIGGPFMSAATGDIGVVLAASEEVDLAPLSLEQCWRTPVQPLANGVHARTPGHLENGTRNRCSEILEFDDQGGTFWSPHSHDEASPQKPQPRRMALLEPTPTAMKDEAVDIRKCSSEEKAQLKHLSQQLEEKRQTLAELKNRDTACQSHIRRLHEYNEAKDAAQMFMGQLAESEGVRTRDLYARLGLDLAD